MGAVLSSRTRNLCFWGDSLTFGTGATNYQKAHPYIAANAGTRGRWYYNGGVGGETSTQIKTRLLAANADYLAATTVIWAGRNNYTDPTTVKSDIAAMIAAIGHDRYLVLSVINGDYANEYIGQSDYQTIVNLNTDLAALYGARFIDVRTPLVAAGAPAGSNPSATDYAHDVPPVGLRFDNIHLLDAAYAMVGNAVYAKLSQYNW